MIKQGKFEAKARTPVSGKENMPRKQKDTGSRLLLSFISSIISLLLCCTMFFGTTMAWFTDSVTNTGNQITIGTLKVDVLFGGESLAKSNAPVFGSQVWKPNAFEVQKLTVQNKGSLDLLYTINLVLQTDVENNADIAKYLKVYVKKVDAGFDVKGLGLEEIRSWDCVGGGTLANIFEKGLSVVNGTLKAGSEHTPTEETYAIALYMTQDVDSSLQGKNLRMNIKLNAYQSDFSEPQAAAAAAEEAPESTEQTTAPTEPEQSTAETTAETAGETVPETTSETIPETTAETEAETVPGTASETVGETEPEETGATESTEAAA